MIEYKDTLGWIAIAIGIISYLPYLRDIFAHKTKPHAFSWLIWGVLTGIAFFGQMFDGGGAGAIVTGVSAILCAIVFVLSLFSGEKHITRSDVWSLIGSGIALILWYLTSSPLLSIVLVSLIDILGFYPTWRKSLLKPYEETLSLYSLSAVKFGIALFALEKYSIITVLFPASVVLLNVVFVGMMLTRRSQK